ncbi:alpha/beta hydrolase [Cellulomonas sp. SG140]|uniref:alpha/beta hydrolase n=1 Tax=Cellulomonas sp. SG140 TaxID=2976536 RepID=UPI0021E895EA|nr:alpha/beta hydrolase-fold protein [Cellulomonas sp. SG140]
MSLTGLPFLLVVLVLTVAALVWGAVRLPARRRTVATVLTRLLAQLGVSALVLLSVAVVMNNQNGWYASWGDLFGTGGTSTVRQSSGGTSAEAALQDKPKGPGLGSPVPVASLPPLPSPGQRVQTFTFTGSRSGLSGRVMVSLPVGYEDPANARKTYPVVMAFHGYPGAPDVWMQGVNLVPSLDSLSGQHKISDVIVVAPQLEFPAGADTECVNGGSGQPQVETWLANDVPQHLASVLRVSRDRTGWATLGFSSGGWCAAMTSMLHPDVFGAGVILGGYFAPIFGNSYVPFHSNDPAAKRYQLVSLATTAPPPVALWLQTSKADSLSYSSSAAMLKAAHAPLSIQSQVDISAGHRISVWADAVPTALTWLGSTVDGFKPTA